MKPITNRSTSKRRTLQDKYKIARKVREAHRKARKEERKNGGPKLKKDPGIPNLHPFKEDIIRKVEAAKARVEDEKQRRKEQRQKLVDQRRNLDLESFQRDIDRRTRQYEAEQEGHDEDSKQMGDVKESSKRAFFKEFKKVVDTADVVLQVLDARDPLGCRSAQVERSVLDAGKKLVLVLNKIDLVPKEVVEKWLKYLRNEFPTIAFKATTQAQKSNLGQASADALGGSSQSSQGAGVLMKLLGNYCRNLNLKTAIRVGVVGYPNVGKSSIINSLKRQRACSVGSTPGLTRVSQEVALDKHIKLIDSPGIVMTSGAADDSLVLRNVVRVDSLEDPISPVEAILKRCDVVQVMERYAVPEFTNVMEFLQHLARRQGRLKKGGVPDCGAAARTILQDWNSGEISYYTQPPDVQRLPSHVSSAVVSEWSKEFDLKSLLAEDQETLATLKSESDYDKAMKLDHGAIREGDFDEAEEMEMEDEEEEEEDGEEMEEEDAAGMDEEEDESVQDSEEEEEGEAPMQQERVVVTSLKPRGQKAQPVASSKPSFEDDEMTLNPRANAAIKKALKKKKKQEARAQGASSFNYADIDAPYDFSTDFVEVNRAEDEEDM